jgi:murein L,D-transpeptidase YcbB/YkuD
MCAFYFEQKECPLSVCAVMEIIIYLAIQRQFCLVNQNVMKAQFKSMLGFKTDNKLYLLMGIGALLISFSIFGMVANSFAGIKILLSTTTWIPSVSATLQDQIAANKKDLYYPASVDRIYKRSGYKLLWIAPDTVKTNASEAMLLLDCVLQYGLNHADYHPKELTYDKLNILIQHFDKASNDEKTFFDLMLTDAMINFMNNLHFGKLNPDYPGSKIDAGDINGFAADAVLAGALKKKDFMALVLNVQPKLTVYTEMQNHMHLLAGQYVGDCYDVPDSDIRKIGINLERLRWINSDDKTYVHINIPSFTLKFHQPDTIYQFNVIVGKPAAPTPTLQSAITYFTTAPEWRVPPQIFVSELLPRTIKNAAYLKKNHLVIYDDKGNYIEPNAANLALVQQKPVKYYARQSPGCDNSLGLIVFRFSNIFDIYMHDSPEQQLFKKPQRAFSHGCVRLEHAERFAELLLKNDGSADKIPSLHKAWNKHINQDFILKKAVPIKITYLTCEVKEGVLTTYDDIYQLDKSLEAALYSIYQPLAVE